MDDKVYCEDCRWSVYEGDYLCSHKENRLERTSYVERNLPLLHIYPFCSDINKNGDCKLFEKRIPWQVLWWKVIKDIM